MHVRRHFLALALAALLAPPQGALAATPAPTPTPTRPDLLFAAASLAVVLDELAPTYQRETGRSWRIQYAASGTLARQLEAGATADAFISADLDWMDYVERRGLVAPGTRANLVGNRLVLVAPADSKLALAIGPGFPSPTGSPSMETIAATSATAPATRGARSDRRTR